VATALPLMLLPDRRSACVAQAGTPRGAPFLQQMHAVVATLRGTPAVLWTMVGFVLVHMAFAGLSFAQLWLARERGFDAAGIALKIGMLQLVFGALGSLTGGVVGDRFARRMKGGHAGLMLLLVALCGPLMVAYRFALAGSALFYAGMCTGFFLPLGTYGPANALIQGLTPDRMRSTVTGLTMMLINVFAIAIGNLAVGAFGARLTAARSGHPLTMVLLGTDVLAIASAIFFALAARGPRPQGAVAAAVAH
jgi:hypothetical protein